MFLGILILVVGLIIVYFETKMRDQNHKIASMLSLVSTLAEDMNGVKIGINHLAITQAGGTNFQQPLEQQNTFFDVKEENKLIEVSDDEDEITDYENDEEDDENDEEDDENDEEDDESVLNNDNESDFNDNESDVENYDNFNQTSNDIKVLKLNINEPENLDLVSNLNLDNDEDKLTEHNYISSKSSNFEEAVLELNFNDAKKDINEQILNISSSDLKTINIDLEDSQTENIDYKKLQLPKLRSIVIEEGLVSHSDAIKLKKQDILKLLGVE